MSSENRHLLEVHNLHVEREGYEILHGSATATLVVIVPAIGVEKVETEMDYERLYGSIPSSACS